jgi:hypothetical protein
LLRGSPHPKFYWWMVDWKWIDGMPVLLTPEELNTTLELENVNNTTKLTIR